LVQNKIIITIAGSLTINRVVHLKKILKILNNLFNEIIIVHEGKHPIFLGRKTRTFNTGMQAIKSNLPIILRWLGCIVQELRRTRLILKFVTKGDIVLFLGIYQPLTLVTVRMRRGYAIHFCGGFDINPSVTANRFLDKAYLFIRWTIQVMLLKLSCRLIFETSSVSSYFNLSGFRGKSVHDGHLFVDVKKFSPKIPLELREYDIGYIGVLSPEKGSNKFIESLPLILKKRPISAVVIGDGILRKQIEDYISSHELQNAVQLKGWVNYSDMPAQLNKIKMLVVPSFSEGLPNIILEAMASGTPVLATPVGGIPDVIKNGETGFLIKSNDQRHIAYKILELLDKPELLKKVSINAHSYIMKNFSYERALKNWRKILRTKQ